MITAVDMIESGYQSTSCLKNETLTRIYFKEKRSNHYVRPRHTRRMRHPLGRRQTTRSSHEARIITTEKRVIVKGSTLGKVNETESSDLHHIT